MTVTPEFSYPLKLNAIGGVAQSHLLEPSAEECAALARRFAIRAITRLKAETRLLADDKAITVTGQMEAQIVQACVVTDADVPQNIREAFTLKFLPETDNSLEEEIELAAEECDILYYSGDVIDLGEAIAETLALAIEPYPRSADAAETLRAAGVLSEDEAGPFSALSGLKKMLEGK